jgi:hypothetical protein
VAGALESNLSVPCYAPYARLQTWLGHWRATYLSLCTLRSPTDVAGALESNLSVPCYAPYARLQTWLGRAAVVPWNKTRALLAAHPTSKDPLHSTAAATALIASDPSVQRALCFLLLPDFINLG